MSFKIGDVVAVRGLPSVHGIVSKVELLSYIPNDPLIYFTSFVKQFPIECVYYASGLLAYIDLDSIWPDMDDKPLYAPKDDNKTKQRECWHEWENYTGLMERYKYCKKCDLKQDF